MTTSKQVFELSYGMSQMAAKHKNDMVSNALARVADKLQRKGETLRMSDLDDIDKKLIAYYHANK